MRSCCTIEPDIQKKKEILKDVEQFMKNRNVNKNTNTNTNTQSYNPNSNVGINPAVLATINSYVPIQPVTTPSTFNSSSSTEIY